MTKDELTELIKDIRNGRTEDDATDWKRQFWELGVPESRKQFLKDIAAMANSRSTEPIRRIVVGVDKSGRLFEAPLPIDEAQLQEVLKAITPHPNVHFDVLEIGSHTITVIEIRPPYDPPYVAQFASDNIIWVRTGSSTTTATRFLLDAYYRAKTRSPSLEVKWWSWPLDDQLFPGDQAEPLTRELTIPGPSLNLEEIRRRVEERSAKAHSQASDAEDPRYPARLKEFEQRASRFLAALDRTNEFGGWYFWEELQGRLRVPDRELEKAVAEARFFSIEILNSGRSPATGLHLIAQFPSWILVFRRSPSVKDLHLPRVPALKPTPPRPRDPLFDLAVPPAVHFQSRMLEAAHQAALPKPQARIAVSEATSLVEITADQLDHQHSIGKPWRFGLLALPSKPTGDTVTVSVRVFHREALEWTSNDLTLRIALE